MAGWATAMKPASTHTLLVDKHNVINYVVPREKGMRSSEQLLYILMFIILFFKTVKLNSYPQNEQNTESAKIS